MNKKVYAALCLLNIPHISLFCCFQESPECWLQSSSSSQLLTLEKQSIREWELYVSSPNEYPALKKILKKTVRKKGYCQWYDQPSSTCIDPLFIAALEGDYHFMKWLLHKGAHPNFSQINLITLINTMDKEESPEKDSLIYLLTQYQF